MILVLLLPIILVLLLPMILVLFLPVILLLLLVMFVYYSFHDPCAVRINDPFTTLGNVRLLFLP